MAARLEGQHDMIADGHPRNLGADPLDDPRTLVAKNQRKTGEPSVAGKDVAMAEASRMNAYENLIIRRRGEIDLLDHVAGGRRPQHRCADRHAVRRSVTHSSATPIWSDVRRRCRTS